MRERVLSSEDSSLWHDMKELCMTFYCQQERALSSGDSNV